MSSHVNDEVTFYGPPISNSDYGRAVFVYYSRQPNGKLGFLRSFVRHVGGSKLLFIEKAWVVADGNRVDLAAGEMQRDDDDDVAVEWWHGDILRPERVEQFRAVSRAKKAVVHVEGIRGSASWALRQAYKTAIGHVLDVFELEFRLEKAQNVDNFFHQFYEPT